MARSLKNVKCSFAVAALVVGVAYAQMTILGTGVTILGQSCSGSALNTCDITTPNDFRAFDSIFSTTGSNCVGPAPCTSTVAAGRQFRSLPTSTAPAVLAYNLLQGPTYLVGPTGMDYGIMLLVASVLSGLLIIFEAHLPAIKTVFESCRFSSTSRRTIPTNFLLVVVLLSVLVRGQVFSTDYSRSDQISTGVSSVVAQYLQRNIAITTSVYTSMARGINHTDLREVNSLLLQYSINNPYPQFTGISISTIYGGYYIYAYRARTTGSPPDTWVYTTYDVQWNGKFCTNIVSNSSSFCWRTTYAVDKNGDVQFNDVVARSTYNNVYRPYSQAAKNIFLSSPRSSWPLVHFSDPTSSATGAGSLYIAVPFVACGECDQGSNITNSLMCAPCLGQIVNLTSNTGSVIVQFDINTIGKAIYQSIQPLLFDSIAVDSRSISFVVDRQNNFLMGASQYVPEFFSNNSLMWKFYDTKTYTSIPIISGVAKFLNNLAWSNGFFMYRASDQVEFLVQVTTINQFRNVNWRVVTVIPFSVCSGGQYLANSNDTVCTKCGPGSFSPLLNRTGTSFQTCSVCAAGSFNADFGQSSCTLCRVNTFAPSSGTFSCLSCPTSSTSLGRIGQTSCSCNVDYYMMNGACVLCPSGASCANSQETRTVNSLSSLPNSWRWIDQSKNVTDALMQAPRFYQCPKPSSCLASNVGACELGYSGPMCGVCVFGYRTSSDGKKCLPCSDDPAGALAAFIVVCIVIAVVCVLTYIRFRHHIHMDFLDSTMMAINFAQLLGSIPVNSLGDAQWPPAVLSVFAVFKYFSFNFVEAADVSCIYRDYSFLDNYWAQVTLTLGGFAAVVTVHSIIFPLFRETLGENYKITRAKLLRFSVIALNFWYPSVGATTMVLLQCQDVGDKSLLRADLKIDCNGSAYYNAWAFNIFFIIVVVFGWIIFLTWYLLRTLTLRSKFSDLEDSWSNGLVQSEATYALAALNKAVVNLPVETASDKSTMDSIRSTTNLLTKFANNQVARNETENGAAIDQQKREDVTVGQQPRRASLIRTSSFKPDLDPNAAEQIRLDLHRLEVRDSVIGLIYQSFRRECIFTEVGDLVRRFFLMAVWALFPEGTTFKMLVGVAISGFALFWNAVSLPWISRQVNVLYVSTLAVTCGVYLNTLLLHSATGLDSVVGSVLGLILCILAIFFGLSPFLFGMLLKLDCCGFVDKWEAVLYWLYGHQVVAHASSQLELGTQQLQLTTNVKKPEFIDKPKHSIDFTMDNPL